jgi:hypothetical protein
MSVGVNRESCASSRFVTLVAVLVTSSAATNAESLPTFDLKSDALWFRADNRTLRVSLTSPDFTIDGQTLARGTMPSIIQGPIVDGQTFEASYPPIPAGETSSLEVKLFLRWSQAESVLRKWFRFRLVNGREGRILKEVVLERIDAAGRPVWTHGAGGPNRDGLVILDGRQSHPVFLPGVFVGVEYPVSSTRCEGGKVVLAHRPGLKMQPGTWYETRTAVYGWTAIGQEMQTFQRCVAVHRPAPRGFHVNYNSWWTSPVPYTERDILALIKVFEEKLVRAHDVSIDSFCIDLGWSDPKSIWEIDSRQFPTGFAQIRDAAQKMRSHLGLWISPSSCYPPALDPEWAKAQGFETSGIQGGGDPASKVRLLCLGGQRYADRFRSRLADLVGRWGIQHLKLDGCNLACAEADHGHQPGDLSSEAIAEGLIGAVQAARKANPDVWVETTCFGYNPSPWWLLFVNSVIGTFGDDAPGGRVPAPCYRESYTSARDFFNLQGAALLPVPIGAQEVLGVVHQSADPFLNDAVLTVMRGHMFLPLYVNPKYMNDVRWQALADVLKWARANSEILDRTVPLLSASWRAGDFPRFSDEGVMPREPYGYAHINGTAGLVALRNPWIAPHAYTLKLAENLGLSPAAENLSVVSLYPEPRLYGEGLKCGATLDLALAPYETLVLWIKAGQIPTGLPRAAAAGSGVKVAKSDRRLELVSFKNGGQWLGPDWTCRLGDVTSALRLTLNANVHVAAPQAELLVLCEGTRAPAVPVGQWKLNGHDAATSTACSETGWAATGLPRHEHWTFVRAPLASGDNLVSLDQFLGGDCTAVSAWVWATKPGSTSAHAGALPQPESISLDGAALIAPLDIRQLPAATTAIERPVERIDGIFLDALEPVSVKQGYGTLQKNRSVWEKPLVIGGQRFVRGLGTHAPSKIVFALDGTYRRFQTWAGADANTSPTVTFEVRVDGVKRWESGLMTRDTPAASVDVDVAGAKVLELVVGDAGEFSADHADWAEARLIR